MAQSIDEILDDLRTFVGGKGREDNFLYSKVYAQSSYVRCVDFSPWIGIRLTKKDTFALAVFYAQLNKSNSQFEEVTRYNLADDNDELVEEEILEEVDNSPAAFEREINRREQEIKHIIQFPFEEYFVNDISLAKMDLVVAWLLRYSGEPFSKAMMPYRLNLKKANFYLEGYNIHKKKQLKMPTDLPNDPKFIEFQHELCKLPFATRLHVFDVFEYSRFGKSPSERTLSYMTMYGTRMVGIDENASARILQQSNLITSFPNGTGFIPPKYIGSISAGLDYAKKIAPVYDEWKSEITRLI